MKQPIRIRENIFSRSFLSPAHALAITTLTGALLLTGCSASSISGDTSTVQAASSTETVSGSITSDAQSATANIAANTSALDLDVSTRDTYSAWDAASATAITFSDSSAEVSGSGAQVSDSLITISEEGTYVLTGSASGVQIVVAAPDNAKVQLVLDGVYLTGQSGPTLWIQQADKVFLTLAEGTTNTLSDADSWTLSGEEDEVDATIYSNVDLTINGSGALTVNATTHNGMSTQDDLRLTGGTIEVFATNNALRGHDSVIVDGATINVEALNGDGIKSTQDQADSGYVALLSGDVTIQAGDKGINAARFVYLNEATTSITSGDDGIHSDIDVLIDGGSTSISAGDDGIHGEYNAAITGGVTTISESVEGLEAQNIEIAGGQNYIASSDDSINGSMADTTTDTAQNNAANGQTPLEGESDPSTTEGNPSSEQEPPTPPDAQSQDGSQAPNPSQGPSGADGSHGMMQDTGNASVVISGGTTELVITKDGDSLDSNGSLSMTGGTLYISGTTTNGNGAIDYDTSGSITGGTIIALSSQGMTQSFDSSSTQASITASVSGNAGDVVSIQNASGETLISYTSHNSFQWVLASSDKISADETYTILVNGQVQTSAVATTQAQAEGGMPGQGGGLRDSGMRA